MADEVGTLLRTEIDPMRKLSAPKASVLHIAAHPEDKGYAFASDFLASFRAGALPKTRRGCGCGRCLESCLGKRDE